MPTNPTQQTPPMAWLPDGRFALRIGLQPHQAWEVREFRSPAGGVEPGWVHSGYLTDAALAAIPGVDSVWPTFVLGAVVAKLEAAGQYTAARMLAATATEMTRSGIHQCR